MACTFFDNEVCNILLAISEITTSVENNCILDEKIKSMISAKYNFKKYNSSKILQLCFN